MYAVIWENVRSDVLKVGLIGVAHINGRNAGCRFATKEEAEASALQHKTSNPGTRYLVVKVVGEAVQKMAYVIEDK